MINLKRMSLGAVLFAVTFLPQLFAQQEVDPTWYDPWAPARVSAHAVPAKANGQKKVQTSPPAAPEVVKAKKIVRDRDPEVVARVRMVTAK
jgi:hypothetical protein